MLVRQVEEELLHRLKTGQYIPGEKLPSIREMCGEFGCSYVIAFRAVQSLKQSGCLETFKGSGTFVARDVQKRLKKKLLAYIFDKSGTTRLNLHDSLRYTFFQRMVREAGCSIPEAVRMMTENPARVMGIARRKGSILPGKDADVVIFDDDINVQKTIIAGKTIG